MTTRFIKNDLIVFGYAKSECDEINKKHNTSLMIPDGIILIIIEYFKNVFEWDPDQCDNPLIITNDGLTLERMKVLLILI